MQYTVKSMEPASTQASRVIREMIINGELVDGERINEVHLSEQLGISRTPIREGLGQLITEQFIDVIPRRGFFVRELSPSEFSDLYDLRPLLDPHALLIGGLPSDGQIDAIERSNDAFLKARTRERAVKADEVFHRTLLARCPNLVLLNLIENLIARTQRYELALFRNTAAQYSAGDTHAKIISALRDQDLPSACEYLRQNLTDGKQPILDWLASRTQLSKDK